MSGSDIPVTYIDNKGGIKSKKCKRKMKIAKEIWLQYFKNNFFIFAAHIPGKLNIEADEFSRIFNKNTEWQLNSKISFELIIGIATQKLIFLQPE